MSANPAEKWKARAWEVAVQHPWSPGRFEREGDTYLFSWITEVASAAYAAGLTDATDAELQSELARRINDARARSSPHG